MKIKSVYIDGLHTAQNKTYTFEDITYLHGRNGAGKSTVLQAIQFALLGYIPGTAKTKAAKLRHAKEGKLHVKLTMIDDSGNDVIIERVLTDTLDMFNTTPENYDVASIINDLELPIFNFNEFVGQTSNKLKDYFIQNILPTDNGNIMWTDVLTKALKGISIEGHEDIIGKAIESVSNLSGDTLSQVVQANQIFKEEQTACNNELKSLQGAIDSLIFYDDYTGSTNINQLDNQIRELSILKDSVIAYRTAEMQSESVRSQLDKAQKEFDELTANGGIEIFKQNKEDISKACDDLSNKIQSVKDEIMELGAKGSSLKFIINSSGRCQYTGEICSSIADMIPGFQDQFNELSHRHQQLKQSLDAYQAEYREKRDQLENACYKINRWNALTDQIVNLKSMVNAMPTKPATDKTDMEIAQDIRVLQDNKLKAYANLKYNATIDDLTQKKFDLELELAVYKAWVKATDVNGLQTEIMKQPFNQLAERMTSYIQTMYGRDDIKAHFIVEAKANSFSFGMIREGKYIPYELLSSGEKCLYALSLMICIIDNTKSPLKVLMLDDALDNLDDIAIENTFISLKNIQNIQFILAGVKHSDNAEDVVVEVG